MVGAEKLPLLHLSCLIRTLAVEILWPMHDKNTCRRNSQAHDKNTCFRNSAAHGKNTRGRNCVAHGKKHMPHNYKLEPNYEI